MIAQWTLDAILRERSTKLTRSVAVQCLRAARRLQIHLSDPLVTYRIGDVALELPLSHELPYYRKRFPHYSTNIGRIGARVKQKYTELSLIDIGANVGDTVAIARQSAHYPVLCVEGSSTYLPLLYRNLEGLDCVEVEPSFLGARSGTTHGIVSAAHGTAHLVLGDEDLDTVSLQTLDEIILRHPRFATSKFVKSDTDGMDCEIVRGGLNFIARAHPVLFFEYDPDLTAQVSGVSAVKTFQVLEECGYRYALVYENSGYLMLMVELQNRDLLHELDGFFSGRGGQSYADICAFHETDSDLALSLRDSELEFFRTQRELEQTT